MALSAGPRPWPPVVHPAGSAPTSPSGPTSEEGGFDGSVSRALGQDGFHGSFRRPADRLRAVRLRVVSPADGSLDTDNDSGTVGHPGSADDPGAPGRAGPERVHRDVGHVRLGAGGLALLCACQGFTGHTVKTVYTSGDLGATWVKTGVPGTAGDGGTIAAANPGRLVIATASAASWLYYSGDGAAQWQTVVTEPDGGQGWADLGFTTASDGAVIHGPAARGFAGQLMLTQDARPDLAAGQLLSGPAAPRPARRLRADGDRSAAQEGGRDPWAPGW